MWSATDDLGFSGELSVEWGVLRRKYNSGHEESVFFSTFPEISRRSYAMTIDQSPIRLGIVGLSTRGWGAMAHSPALFHTSLRSTYSLTALQTSSESTAAAAKELYASKMAEAASLQAHYGEDPTALVNDPNVDVVGIIVKAPDHKAIFDAAVAAGKHIFVEYPPGRTLEESLEMRRAVSKHGHIQVAVGLQAIQSSAIRKVCCIYRDCV